METQKSVNDSTYRPKDFNASQVDKGFQALIKANHFSIGHTKDAESGHYLSTNKMMHSELGDASKIRSKMDPSRLTDLRMAHFKVGDKTRRTDESVN